MTAPTPSHAQLASGQTLTRVLAAGDEVFCASGSLHLSTSALTGDYALPGQSLRLQAGQSWRAPGVLWIQVTAIAAQARIRWSPAVMPVAPARPADWGTRIGALFKHWRAARS